MNNDDPEVVWEGRPYGGLFLRPGDLLSIIVTLALGLAILFYALSEEFSFVMVPLAMTLLYLTIGRLWHDAFLRRDLRYVLRKDQLELSSDRTKKIIRTIPIAELENVRPSWSGDTASIELPLVPQDVFKDIYDGLQRAVPALRSHRRLELIEGASKVARLIRSAAARSATKSASRLNQPSLQSPR